MTLTAAISFLKSAVERNTPGGTAALYVFHEGYAFARSAAILACHPIDLDGTFALPADDLDAALARLKEEPEIGAGEGTIILKRGRLKSSLKVLAAEAPHVPDRGDWSPVPAGLQSALKLTTPFASDEGTWQRGVHFTEGKIAAINNRSAAEAPILELQPMGAILDADAARYIADLPLPSGWVVAENSFTFGWANGAWVRCQLLNATWPAIADRVMTDAGDDAPIKITDEWREAVAHLAVLGDGAIRIASDGITGARSHSDSAVEFETGVINKTIWNADLLQQVFAVATSWNPDAEGPARWIGDGICGVAMRRRG
jgi:hypothetical protein